MTRPCTDRPRARAAGGPRMGAALLIATLALWATPAAGQSPETFAKAKRLLAGTR